MAGTGWAGAGGLLEAHRGLGGCKVTMGADFGWGAPTWQHPLAPRDACAQGGSEGWGHLGAKS